MKKTFKKIPAGRLSIAVPGSEAFRIDLLSLILILPLAAALIWMLFPILAPELSLISYALMTLLSLSGLAASILLRAALLMLCARIMRIPVETHLLLLFGPTVVTRMENIRRGAEVTVAAVHLTAILLIAMFFLWILATGFGDRPSLRFLSPTFLLAFGHFGILVIYLLPALPLEGGRFLRAALAARKGWPRANRIALVASRIVAGALAVGGIALLFAEQIALGISLLFFAILLACAAANSPRPTSVTA